MLKNRAGANGETRTLTGLPPLAPEASTSTNSATLAMARLVGFEPTTLGLEGRCSIRMSYRRIRY